MAGRYEPEDVRGDLLYLRKGPGYSAGRLASRPALTAVLGGASEPPEVLRERLESAIQSLRDADAQLLLGSFGLTAETGGVAPLWARRDRIGARLGIGREAVADREVGAIEHLLTQLITGWYPKSPIGIRVPESHNGVVQHAVSLTTLVRDRRHLETRHHYRFFATFDGAKYLALSTGQPASPIVLGTDFTVRTVATQSGYLHQFWHREPLRRGQTYDLEFRIVNPNENDPYWITEEGLAFHEPTRFAAFKVVFIGDAPKLIWRYEGLTSMERPGLPTEASTLELGEMSQATATFHDLYGGLFHGIAWDW